MSTKKSTKKSVPLHLKRTDLVALVAKQEEISKVRAKVIVDNLIALITKALETGGSVDLHKFGVFKATIRVARAARNPKTGESMSVPQRTVVKFRPSAALKRIVDPNADIPATVDEAGESDGE